MTKKKGASFIKGALILSLASILVKIIGAVFRIPLTWLVGDYTMGLYSFAYRYYSILLTIATAGIPIAISKMIAESRALDRHRETGKILKTAIILCSTIGIAGTLILIGASRFLAENVIQNVDVIPSIIVLAPAVLFMAITAGFRGYFQGHENMVPTSISQVIEALSRLLIGLSVAFIFIKLNFDRKFVSAGVILGITTGTILTVALMLGLYTRKRIKEGKVNTENGECRNTAKILTSLLSVAVPVTLGSLVMNLTTTIDSVLIPLRLPGVIYEIPLINTQSALENVALNMINTASQVYDTVRRTSMYSIYDNYALPMFNLVPSVIISLNVSVTPTISAAFAVKDFKKLSETLLSALRIVVIFTLPAAVGISVLSYPILSILYKSPDSASIAAPVLSILAIGSFFLCASSLTSTSMQALGRAELPLITMAAGAVVKVVSNYFLVAIPGIELNGAAIGTVLCYLTITLINMIFLRKIAKFKPPIINTFFRPLVSSVIMGAVVLLFYKLSVVFLGNTIAVAISVFIGIVIYFVSMLLCKGITKDDVLGLPKGEKIANLLFKTI